MDWRLNEIKEEVVGRLKMYRNIKNMCDKEAERFSDVYNTFDKFEASKHEFWRGRSSAYNDMIVDLQDLLKEIESYNMKYSDDVEGDELPWEE